MIKKLSLIFLGIAIAAIISEGLLRLNGHLYYSAWMKEETKEIDRDKDGLLKVEDRVKVSPEDAKLTRILCLGDSWTFGKGAMPGYSYPAQLQTLLTKKSPDKYRVYNGGIPGFTSTKLLKHLPEFLDRYKPDIVIILIGMNDAHNPFTDEFALLSGSPRKYYYGFLGFITDLRLYKVIISGLDGMRQEFGAPRIQAQEIHARNIDHSSIKYTKIATFAYESGKIGIAEKFFKKAIDIYPYNEKAIKLLGHLYQSKRQFDKALTYYGRLLEINPYASYRDQLYRFLFLMYQETPSLDIHKKITYLIKKIPSDTSFKNPGMPFVLRQQITMKNLINNLGKITNALESRGITPLFQTYLREEDGYLHDTAIAFFEKRNTLFVDNRKSLENLPNNDTYFALPDTHPNAKGYNLMAENVCKKIMEILSLHPESSVDTGYGRNYSKNN